MHLTLALPLIPLTPLNPPNLHPLHPSYTGTLTENRMTVVEGWFGTVDLVGPKLDDGKEICHAMREMVLENGKKCSLLLCFNCCIDNLYCYSALRSLSQQ
jgi:hypothetical protein